MMIKIGGLSAAHSILIARSLTQECLLGADFLSHHHCVLDLQQQVLYAGGKHVYMCPPDGGVHESHAVCFVRMAETTEVPPCCQIHLPVRIDRVQMTGQNEVLVEPLDDFMEQHCLVVARSLAQASSELTLIQVLNPSPVSVALYKNEKVAVAKSINHILCNTTQEAEHDSSIKIKMEDAVQQMLHGTTKLSEKERDAAVALLSEFKDVIALGDDDLGRTGIVQHSIETGSSQPVRQQSRRLPFHQKPVVRKLLDSMLSRDIIEPSHGPWASPVVLVKKKDGSIRFCVDFRKVNELYPKRCSASPKN